MILQMYFPGKDPVINSLSLWRKHTFKVLTSWISFDRIDRIVHSRTREWTNGTKSRNWVWEFVSMRTISMSLHVSNDQLMGWGGRKVCSARISLNGANGRIAKIWDYKVGSENSRMRGLKLNIQTWRHWLSHSIGSPNIEMFSREIHNREIHLKAKCLHIIELWRLLPSETLIQQNNDDKKEHKTKWWYPRHKTPKVSSAKTTADEADKNPKENICPSSSQYNMPDPV